MRELFEIELDYWQVKNSLNHELTDPQKDLQLLFDKEPSISLVNRGGAAYEKWAKLGPLNASLFDLADEHEIVDCKRTEPLRQLPNKAKLVGRAITDTDVIREGFFDS